MGSGAAASCTSSWARGRSPVARCASAGQPIAPGAPRDGAAAGVGLVPEDRKTQALLVGRTDPVERDARDPAADLLAATRALARGATGVRRAEIVQRARVRCQTPEQPARSLSGGNQQRMIFGRWMAAQPRLLLLDEPTRGVDVGAKAEIYKLIEEARAGRYRDPRSVVGARGARRHLPPDRRIAPRPDHCRASSARSSRRSGSSPRRQSTRRKRDGGSGSCAPAARPHRGRRRCGKLRSRRLADSPEIGIIVAVVVAFAFFTCEESAVLRASRTAEPRRSTSPGSASSQSARASRSSPAGSTSSVGSLTALMVVVSAWLNATAGMPVLPRLRRSRSCRCGGRASGTASGSRGSACPVHHHARHLHLRRRRRRGDRADPDPDQLADVPRRRHVRPSPVSRSR